MIDQNHKQKFEAVWDHGDYRQGSTAHRMVTDILTWIPDGAQINDYGCGTGRCEVEFLRRRNYRINMIDIAENALEGEARNILRQPDSPLQFICADLADLAAIPHAEWGICINTLMTVQADKLERILDEIRRTCDNLVCEVYDFSDMRLGKDMTTVKMDRAGWQDTLSRHWSIVENFPSPESPRRYIFVCHAAANSVTIPLSSPIKGLKGCYAGQTAYIVGRGASLLNIRKEHFGPGPVIVLNEAIINVYDLDLDNDVYSQWRNGDIMPELVRYLRPGDALILCENPVLKDPASALQMRDYPRRYHFECRRDLGCEPGATFSHKAALEIAVRIFGCTNLVMVGFDSYRGDSRTLLQDGFVHSEYRPGDYHEQIDVILKRLAELPDIKAGWLFPDNGIIGDNQIKLNLGCGTVRETGYINIDMHDPEADITMDTRELKYADNSIDEIYSSHLLEHFGKNEIIPVLREWARVLRLGGVLKMNLPNLEWCIRNWLSQPEEQRWGFNLDMIFGNQANPGEYHKTGFSRAHLECYLRRAGFDEISIADHWSHAQQCFWVTAKKKDV